MIEKKIFEGKSAHLVISGVDSSLVNAIRRTLLSEIQKLAIDEVIFYDNTSPMTNEIVAHRLSMIPIPADVDLFVPRDQCACGGAGCPNCTLIYTLSKEGPCTVYSGDLEAQRSEFSIKDKEIPIVKLAEGQRLILEAMAILGSAREHVKYQAAFAVGYKNYPVISIDYDKCDLGKTCIDACPVGIIKKEGNRIVITDIEKCTLCKECENTCEFGAIKVSFEENKFIFRFETDGVFEPEDVLKRAIDILAKKLQSFREEIFAIKEEKTD
jgi:DNA-directed RNA polymerase subunit D